MLTSCLSLAVSALPAVAHAQPSTGNAWQQGAAAPAPAVASVEMASGEVRRIYKAQKRITLRHGEIKNLEMPPMSMVFQVRDAALLDAVKVGDKVLFSVDKDTDGSLVVTAMKPAP
jgi:Cu(I)/Ag(I) efflux system protein CusF